MIIINTVNNERFSLNGIEYFKNFLSFVAGDKVAIYNAYDKSDQRIELALYSEFNLNGIVYGSATLLQAALINVIYTRDSLGAVNTVLKGSVVPTSTPTGSGVAFWVATQAGTYTNFGGVVVNANSFAVISRDAVGAFSISQTALDISSKVNVSDVVDNLTTDSATKVASSRQVKVLNEKISITKTGTGTGVYRIKVPSLANGFTSINLTHDRWLNTLNELKVNFYSDQFKDFYCQSMSTGDRATNVYYEKVGTIGYLYLTDGNNSLSYTKCSVANIMSDTPFAAPFVVDIVGSLPVTATVIPNKMPLANVLKPIKFETLGINQFGFIKIALPIVSTGFANTFFSISNYDTGKVTTVNVSGYVNSQGWGCVQVGDTTYDVYFEIASSLINLYVGNGGTNWRNYTVNLIYSNLYDSSNAPIINYIASVPVGATFVKSHQSLSEVDKTLLLNGNKASNFIDISNYERSVIVDPNCNLINTGITPYNYSAGIMFKTVSKKKINGVSIPIVKNFKDGLNFTDGILYKIMNGDIILKQGEIPFSELTKYNNLLITDSIEKFDYNIFLDSQMILNVGDYLAVTYICKSASDKIGSPYRFATAGVEPVSDFWNGTGFCIINSSNVPHSSSLATFNGYSKAPTTAAFNFPYGLNVKLIFAQTAGVTKSTRSITAPRRIYTVLNNIGLDLNNPSSINLMKGNNSAAVYLDHFFTGIKEELDIKFKSNKSDRLVFTSHTKFTGTSAIALNKGVNILKTAVNETIIGNSIKDVDFKLDHISTLNSATSTKKCFYLCIGDSVTVGQYANDYGSIADNKKRYSALTEQMFMRDQIYNGGTGYHGKSIGNNWTDTIDWTLDGVTRQYKNFVSGVSGATSGDVGADYLSGGNYSISYFLSKYRTMDDSGNRLPSGAAGATVTGVDGLTYTIGTSVTNINQYDVCRPTHIIITLGLNDATVTDWYNAVKKMAVDFKANYTAMGWGVPSIGIAIPDTGATIFPSRHLGVSNSSIEWDVDSDTRRDKMASFVEKWKLENADANEETDKVWLLPFFWSFPCGESVSYRPANLPDADVNSMSFNSSFKYGSGWGQTTHVNSIGHYNYAYQLYAWMKYTLAL